MTGEPGGAGEFGTHKRDDGPALVETIGRERNESFFKGVDSIELTDFGILSVARKMSKYYGGRLQHSPQEIEDITQDVIIQVLKQKIAHPDGPIQGGLIRVKARSAAADFVDKTRRHEATAGLKVWREQVRMAKSYLGRNLTTAELDAVAEEVRATWHDQRRQPTKGFQHDAPTVLEIDKLDPALAEVIANHHQPETVDLDDRLRSDDGNDLVDDIYDKENTALEKRQKKDVARRRLWNSITDPDLVSPAREASLTGAESKEALRVVKRSGGALEIATRVTAGTALETEKAGLFAPFGPVSEVKQLNIAREITDRPNVADRLWLSVLDFSNQAYRAK